MYEGHSTQKLAFMPYVSAMVGCKFFVMTNSSGGGVEGMKHGSFMLSEDHFNNSLSSSIPQVYFGSDFKLRYCSPSDAHSKYLNELAEKVAQETDNVLFKANYCMTSGPSYETPTETLLFRKMGGGAFGMSTVIELQATAHTGMQGITLSMITNLAAGL